MNTTQDSRAQIKWVTQNHQLVAYQDAKISVMAPGLTFAALVFEGFRAYWNAEQEELLIFRLDDHLKRLQFSMALLELDDPPNSETLAQDILATLKANDFREDTYIRLQVYVDDWGSMTATGPVGSTVICRPRPRVATFETGQTFITSSWSRNLENASPPRIKASGNYLNSRLAGLEAKRQGAGGAVMLNGDGTISEGPGGCLFLMRDGVFLTPDVNSGILESITRQTILDMAAAMDIEMAERPIGRTELYLAEEAFYCGTGQEIGPVNAFDGRPVGNGEPGPVTRALQARFDEIVRGRSAAHEHWLTRVYAGADNG
ncbi:MAG: branched-chain-amino-acid transaminase [Rhodospirillaceae bacterium]|nr:branched-chain-amino-acid transaminase [Rhodospirillaceae bacterium]MBT4490004.1 branched-chain-amino-acid transaminase [Rhodospirillaceae bacterium]MBT5192431.1 branched-chain-amino-acid transaminase [Rhodospirillaceae bacterium]MBT5898191.1 branched-chain-amino-acid transaminase [Rhodospirillaceae bacterium]MBT6428504.1 branched-chain-amino-acid transaminase [Rhodospirillaceae bacterium]